MIQQKLLDIISDYHIRPMAQSRRRERVQRIARLACQTYPGDLCEIGAHVGKTTLKLLEVAKEFDRHVLVVDPWEPGTPGCKGGEFKKFKKRTEPLRDHLDVLRLSSQDQEAIAALRSGLWAFALVDGLHTFIACRIDINSVSHASIISVDDILQIEGVHEAFLDARIDYDRVAIEAIGHGTREGYLI